ncbi:Uncharacterised protein [Porphyromonas cangingivalis]|nr:Uncharacterised protein [Porphyromonas cangingivalis]
MTRGDDDSSPPIGGAMPCGHLTVEVSLLHTANIKQNNNKTMDISDFEKIFPSLSAQPASYIVLLTVFV